MHGARPPATSSMALMERMLLLWDEIDDTLGIVRHLLGNAWHGLTGRR